MTSKKTTKQTKIARTLPFRKVLFVPILVGFVGIYLSYLGFLIVNNSQKSVFENNFVLEARENVQSIETSIDKSLEVLLGCLTSAPMAQI